jgi:hypothetical protein
MYFTLEEFRTMDIDLLRQLVQEPNINHANYQNRPSAARAYSFLCACGVLRPRTIRQQGVDADGQLRREEVRVVEVDRERWRELEEIYRWLQKA